MIQTILRLLFTRKIQLKKFVLSVTICLRYYFFLSRFFFAKSPPIFSVNLRPAAALFETNCQLLILASPHLPFIDHLSITHRVLLILTQAGGLANVILSRNADIAYL